MRAIELLINGNIKDAKRSAKSMGFSRIMDSAHFNYGMTIEKAMACAKFLKNEISFQEYCDIDNKKSVLTH